MSESALSLAELSAVAQDHFFLDLLGDATVHARRFGLESAFSIRKNGGVTSLSHLYSPTSRDENSGYDPSNKLDISNFVLSDNKVDPAIAGLLHSHPSTMWTSDGFRGPSLPDMRAFRDHFYPANPGHIGGIIMWGLPFDALELFLYRAIDKVFSTDRLSSVIDGFWPDDPKLKHSMLYAAGISTASLVYTDLDDTPLGLEKLSMLYE